MTSTSTTVKCASCDVVINELLAFLWNVLDFMDEESIHQLCTSSFSAEDITNAKKLLFESLPSVKKPPNRRKEGKKRMSKELDDIICIMKGTSSELFPIFVAKDLHKLPPVSFDHVDVTRILRDITRLQNHVSAMEEKFITIQQFEVFKQSVENMKHASIINNSPDAGVLNINMRRGAYTLQDSYNFDSGPIGLQYVPIKTVDTSQSVVNNCPVLHTSSLANVSCAGVSQKSTNGRDEAQVNATAVSNGASRIGDVGQRAANYPACESEIELPREATSRTVVSQNVGSAVSPTIVTAGPVRRELGEVVNKTYDHSSKACSDVVACARVLSENHVQMVRESVTNNVSLQERASTTHGKKLLSEVAQNGKWKEEKPTEDWILVQRKRLRNRFVGMKGKANTAPECNFKAAEVRIPFYIYNIDKASSMVDIANYINCKTGLEVKLQQVNMKLDKQYVAYKFLIPREKLSVFMDENLWPSGVSFRRFVSFNKKSRKAAENILCE